MKKDYRNIIFALMVAVFVLQMLVMKQDAKINKEERKPIIALSTFSLYDIARHLSDDSFELVMILPVGVDAHSYEPTPQIMTKIDKSVLVVYSGAGLEPWISNFNFKSKTVDMSEHVDLRELEEKEFSIHAHHDQQCAHNKLDPHYWLDIENMKKATKIMAQEFISLKPESEEIYLSNRDKYLEMLNKTDDMYKQKLKSCYLDTIIVNHNAFSYLSSKYGFNIKALSGFSPDTEIAPKDVIRIINDIKMYKVSTVFFESFANDKAIKSLAKDANVKTQTLQPLGNITKDELAKDYTYENIMEINLLKISKALICK